MLKLLFVNDGTGDEFEGNYKWRVMINDQILATGELKCHARSLGWKGLIRHFVYRECQR